MSWVPAKQKPRPVCNWDDLYQAARMAGHAHRAACQMASRAMAILGGCYE